jgi:UDP-N-acetylglucosamine 1-carboxyvinyltransferase
VSLDTLHITGGHRLEGQVQVSGSKNGTLPLLAASLLVPGESVIDNVPDIRDVQTMLDVLRALGAKCAWEGQGRVRIDASNITSVSAPYNLVRKMRGSFYVAGPLLARFGEAEVPLPGGCTLGARPVNYHLQGFKALGAEVQERQGCMYARSAGLKGTEIYLNSETRSVGATVNIMMAAVLAEGTTVIENASREPEVICCEGFLRACGADITGLGTTRLVIRGVPKLHSATFRAIPDRMETGTFLVAGLVTRGDITVTGTQPEHVSVVVRELIKAGAQVEQGPDFIRLRSRMRPNAVNITTEPYPGFPTDMQPNIAVAAAIAVGVSHITERIFDMRFSYTDELIRLGADIQLLDRVAVIRGVERLDGAPVEAMDLRAGSALVLAGLVAQGQTEISGASVLDRGYERFEEKLVSLGAEVRRELGAVEEEVC